MSTTTPMTAEQLIHLHSDGRCELVAGELHMMSPSGWKHGRIVGRIHGLLWNHVSQNKLGEVFGAETGFWIGRDPDTVRAPDVAFIARENLPEKDPAEAFWPGAPDLAVEVVSPGDSPREVKEKSEAWIAAGVKLLWVVDPKFECVTVCRSASDVETKAGSDVLEGGEVVRGFRCSVADIFAPLA
ncbi:MAG: Uma2 family endonuclease [Planctomycetes bacterium]|nr:Uma2 family endonuclease [Planctomycetota bacterium]